MVYKIYKITNIINDKIYVGFTSQTIEKRFNQHKSKSRGDNLDKLHKAMKKYGVDNFNIELISEHPTINDALANEKKLISELDLTKNGYNLSSGGEWSPNEKIKLRGRTFTEEHRKNISKNHADIRGDKNPFFGKKHTLESREKISKNHVDMRGEKSPFFGKKTITSFKPGKDHPNSKPITINSVEYFSISDACKTLNITRRQANKLRS
jgi:group I intron endonuclease